MFPIAKDTLSLREISDFWAREIKPSATSKELWQILEAAWWLGELRGDSALSPLQFLRQMFASMRDRDDLGIVFLIGNSPGPLPIKLPDKTWRVDVRQQIRVPSSNIDSWNEISCRDAFQALAETCSLDSYPELATAFGWIRLSYDEFASWLTKRGFGEPAFWRPQVQKCWKARPGNTLTPGEAEVLSAINKLFPDGKIPYRASSRNTSINKHLANSGSVSARTIQRTRKKIVFG